MAGPQVPKRMVARGAAVREAGHDAVGARRARIGLSRFESTEPSMESRNCDRLALSFSVLDTRIFSSDVDEWGQSLRDCPQHF